jgi:IS5 family transposase
LAEGFVPALRQLEETVVDLFLSAEAKRLADQIDHFVGLAQQVQDQAQRRVLKGEKVPASEKLLSLFETHTDIICRGKTHSPAEFGHKVFFSVGKSGLILDYRVCEGNPGDDSLWPEAIERHAARFGNVPKEMTGDRRFYSRDNIKAAETAGVKHVAIPKPGKPTQESVERTKQPWWKRLMRFRSGIEGILSWLLRSFGLHRCLWRGLEHFSAYVGWAVLGCNLTQFARKA